MDALHRSRTLLLVCVALYAGAGCAQVAQSGDLETYRLDLIEQVGSGKLTGGEAEALYRKRRAELSKPVNPDVARAGRPSANAVPRGGSPALDCQTYPDGRTECR